MTKRITFETYDIEFCDDHFASVKSVLNRCAHVFVGELANQESKKRIYEYMNSQLTSLLVFPKSYPSYIVEVTCIPDILIVRVTYGKSRMTLTLTP